MRRPTPRVGRPSPPDGSDPAGRGGEVGGEADDDEPRRGDVVRRGVGEDGEVRLAEEGEQGVGNAAGDEQDAEKRQQRPEDGAEGATAPKALPFAPRSRPSIAESTLSRTVRLSVSPSTPPLSTFCIDESTALRTVRVSLSSSTSPPSTFCIDESTAVRTVSVSSSSRPASWSST
ncbi:hypothetical protein BRD05_04840 [Halobacteriales archaeon QS_9_70_65]|nr:MAG: hypothetical protein BRD05_04840 [Halobacteriales archaeon QS_9_70_65]